MRKVLMLVIPLMIFSILNFNKVNAATDFGSLVNLDKDFTVKFSLEVDEKSLDEIIILEMGADGLYHQYINFKTYVSNENPNTIIIDNQGLFKSNNDYLLIIDGVKSTKGRSLKEFQIYKFKTIFVEEEMPDEIENSKDLFEKRNDWNYKKTENLDFYINDFNMENYFYIYESSDKIFNQIEEYFNVNIKNGYTIYLHEGEFEGKVANYDSGNNIIYIRPENFGNINRNQDVRYHFAHESVHAVMDERWNLPLIMQNRYNIWLVEGYAEYVAKQKVEFDVCTSCGTLKKLKSNVKEYGDYIRTHRGYTAVSMINSFNDFEMSIKYMDYYLMESMVYYLIEQYGVDSIISITDYLAKGHVTADVLKTVLNKTETEIISEWKKYFNI